MFQTAIQHLFESSAQRPLAILFTLVLVVVAGTTAQILANRLRIPATGPLLITGLLLGPAGLGLVLPDRLGDGLRVIVSAAVAIVVFEGGLLLDVRAIRETSRAVLGLVTVGLLITTVLAGIASRLLIGWSWELSILFGAIISVTGPTVIQPIVRKVRLNRRVRVTLESESIIADPLGVILAAVIFTAITDPGGWREAGPHLLETLATGVATGLAVAGFVWLTAKRMHMLPAQYARMAILGAALTAYTLSELSAHESGVLAAAVAGITIGTLDIPHKENVAEFKGDLALLSVSAVFILLAGGLKLSVLAEVGWGGVAVVALVMFVVRPARVFLSTWGSELRTNEKLFVAFMGPRGIVAASVATLFSLRLVDTGHPNGRFIEALVFAVILATVLIEGSAAAWLARWFKVMPQHIIIVGADATGRQLATDLSAAHESVALIDTNAEALTAAASIPGVQVIHADATDLGVLKRAGAADAKCLVAATRSDKVNLLICQLARASFGVGRLLALVTTDSSRAAFEAADIEVVNPARAAARVFENRLLRPSLYRILSEEGGPEHIAEVEVAAPTAVGRTLADLRLEGVVVVALRRGETIITPSGKTRMLAGDIATLLGSEKSIEAATRLLRNR